MQLPVTSETLLAEMKGAKSILEYWIAKVEEGIPMVDVPSSPEQLEDFLRCLCGELTLTSSKCESLSDVLSGAA
jgi:hypothetical protein